MLLQVAVWPLHRNMWSL